MKAITLHQPWASLIAIGAKEYETRSWSTPYRGLIAIHAGKNKEPYEDMCDYILDHHEHKIPLPLYSFEAEVVQALKELHPKGENGKLRWADIPFGAVVAVCELTAIYRTELLAPKLSQREYCFGNYDYGRYAWRLKVVEIFWPAIPAKGAQGLWDWHKS